MSYKQQYTKKCDSCAGNGQTDNYYYECHGTERVYSGKSKCGYCAGTGKIVEEYLVKDEKCSYCFGSGKNVDNCNDCKGSGKSRFQPFFDHSNKSCPTCDGSGKLAYKGECSSCHGTGKVHKYIGTKPYNGCFITTAVCQILGYNDSCYELTVLRSFRDSIIQNYHSSLLEEYVNISPHICSSLLNANEKESIAHSLLYEYIHPAIDLIDAGKNEEALAKYREMVYLLKSKFRSSK